MGRITFAVIAAGGFGTRLKPFTDTAPKPMLPILGKPLLEWHVEQFKKYGVTDFVFTLHYLPEVIQEYFGDGSRFGVRIRYVVESEPLGSGGSLKLIKDLPEHFFYTYGDVFSLLDYNKFQDAFEKKGPALGMQRVGKTDTYADADVAEIDEDGRMKAIHRKPHARAYEHPYRMRGAFILDKAILAHVPDTPADLAKDILAALVESGAVFYGYESDEYSKGIDTLDKLREVEDYMKNRFAGR